jgi:uncharacterized membrane protein YhhN
MPAQPSPRLLTGAIVVSALVAIMSLSGPVGWERAHYVFKPLTTILLLALAASASDRISRRYQRLIVVGLACSLVGDVLLMLPVDRFAFGLAAFLLAHLCYLAAFLGESGFIARPGVLMGYTLVSATLLAAVFPFVPVSLRFPVIVYVVVITLMATQAAIWMLDAPSAHSRRAALGAAWFVASDATLAIARFRADVPYRDLVVLGTYYLAQYFLARSITRAGNAAADHA